MLIYRLDPSGVIGGASKESSGSNTGRGISRIFG